jgi:tetratricopeptide (TPR) repeat protein
MHLLRKHLPAARADFEKAIDLEPKDSKSERLVTSLVELGRLLHKEGKYQAALDRYDRALWLRPEMVLVEPFRAETLLELKRLEKAGQALDRCLKATARPPALMYQVRALIYAEAKELPAAIEMYTLALEREPRNTSVRCLRGWLYLVTDAVPLALKDFEECLRLDSNSGHALAGRGIAQVRLRSLADPGTAAELRQQLLTGAVADAEAAERNGPVTDRLLYNLACLYARAATQLDGDARAGQGRQAAELSSRYQKRALDYLRRALEMISAERRAAFWGDQVSDDPALKGLQRSREYLRLEARYGRQGL